MYRSWIQISVLHTVLSFNYYNLHTRAQPRQKMFLGLKSPAKAPKIEIHSQKPKKNKAKLKDLPVSKQHTVTANKAVLTLKTCTNPC